MRSRVSGPKFWAGCAGVFVVTGLLTSWDSLGYYWNLDDLHLVRAYSRQELLGTLTGNWDPDEIETLGFRPMTTFFNHVRAKWFGEQVVVHRLFLVGLFSTFLTVLGSVAVRLGEHRWAVLLAGIMAVTAKNSYFHFVWITDGNHLLQAFFFAVGAHFLLDHLSGRTRWSGVWAVLFAGFALLTREESLVIFPVMLLMGFYWVNFCAEARRYSSRYEVPARLRAVAIGLLGITAVFWMWRSNVVPDAPQFHPDVSIFSRVGTMILWTVCLSGQYASRWVCITVGALAMAFLCTLDVRDRLRALVWLFAALISTMIGSVEIRPNLLVFPIAFYTLFLASVVVAVSRKRPRMQVPVALVVALLVILSVRASRLEQLSLHPMSADQIKRDWEFIYGPYSGATIPSQRKGLLRAKLARLNVTGADFDIDQWIDALRASAPDRPDGNEVFLPSRHFLER